MAFNSSLIYACSYSYNIVKSNDGGNTWSSTTSLPVPLNTNDLIANAIGVSPTNPNIVVVGTSSYSTPNAYVGLFISYNGGSTFTQVPQYNVPNANVTCIDVTSDSLAYVGYSGLGLYSLVLNPTLAASFGAGGLCVFQNNSWSQPLRPTSPVAMATYGGSNLVAAFPGDGLYQYNGTTLSKISPNGNVTTMLGLPNVIYVSLGASGLWKWDGANFTQVPTLNNVTSMVYSSATSMLYVNCQGSGVYSYDGVHTPIQTTAATAKNMILVCSTLYGDFGQYGIWKYSGSGTNWGTGPITNATSDILVVAGTTLYGDFAGYGVYEYSGSGANWTQITNATADILVVSGTTLYGDFGQYGVWKYSGSGTDWGSGPITNAHANKLIFAGTTLYGDFGQYGIWKYSGSSTNWGTGPITPATSDILVVSGTTLYGDFGVYGVWEYSGTGTNWAQISKAQATQIVVY